MAAQTTDALAGDKAADAPPPGAGATAEPERFNLKAFPLSDKAAVIIKESDKDETLRVEEPPTVYVRNVLQSVNINYDDFYKNFTTISFFGHQVLPVIHKDFAVVLKKIEQDYAQNKTPKEAGEALGIKSVGGSRDYPTSAAFSMHLVGMAIDINYTDSPYIGASASDVFGRAGLLIDGTAYSYNENARTYEQLSSMQQVLLAYFALLDDPTKLEEKLQAPVKTAWPISKETKTLALAKSWEGVPAALAKQQIQTDLSFIAKRWERTEEQIKKHGFLGVSKELVATMTKGRATDWGGGGYGDMMHFDMRTQGKGATIHQAFRTYEAAKKKEGHAKYEAEAPEARKARRDAEKAAAEKAAAKKAKAKKAKK
jgi:hypothetical protein